MAERILIVDDDVDTLRLVGLMLQRQGYQILAASDGQKGLEQAFEHIPDLILLDVMMPVMDGYEVARRLRANQNTAPIPILMFTAKTQLDDKVTGFEAGADDYLTKPTHPTELQAHVKALLARSKKTNVNPPSTPSENPAYNIGVISARGGFGVSTIAINLASALYSKTKVDVVYSELRPGEGTIALDLGLANPNQLSELLNANPKDITRQKIKDAIFTHTNGLHLLLASYEPKQAALSSTAIPQFEALVSRLTFMAKFNVFDLGSGLNLVAQKIIKSCNEVIVIAEPMTNSIIHTKALLADLVEQGMEKRKIAVVLNYRIRSDIQLSVGQVNDQLGHPVSVTFTPAPEIIVQATRLKNTVYFMQPDGLTGQQYQTLANQITERVPKQAPIR